MIPATTSAPRPGPRRSARLFAIWPSFLRSQAAVGVFDGAEVPVGEGVVIDVEGEVQLGRDLEVGPLPLVADTDERPVHVLEPNEGHVYAVGRTVGELYP